MTVESGEWGYVPFRAEPSHWIDHGTPLARIFRLQALFEGTGIQTPTQFPLYPAVCGRLVAPTGYPYPGTTVCHICQHARQAQMEELADAFKNMVLA